jgi:Phage portal protein, SPP1 Gp6-like
MKTSFFGSSYGQVVMPPLALNEWERNGEDSARWARYRRYLDFYEGEQWSERPAPGDRRYIVNYSRLFTQKMASYLLGKGYQTEVIANKSGKTAENRAREVEEMLAEVSADNALDLLDYDSAINAAILGDAGWKITLQPARGSTFYPQGVGRPARAGRLTVRAVDMHGLSAKFRSDDLRQPLWVSHQYALSLTEAREMFGKGVSSKRSATVSIPPHPNPLPLGERESVQIREEWTDSRFCIYLNSESEPYLDRPNPYGFIPYVLFPNVRRPRHVWGDSDLIDLLPVQSELNTRFSTIGQILHYSGNPVLVLENIEATEQPMRVGAGAVWTLPENSKAYLLELLKEGQLQTHIDYIQLLYQVLHDLSEIPRAAFGRDLGGSTPSSGVALEILLQPLTQKVLRKRAIWDEALYRRNLMIQKLANFGQVHRTRTLWQDPLPKDRQALVANEIALVGSGIHSRQTAARHLGDEQPAITVMEAFEELRQFSQLGKPPTTRASGLELQAIVNAGS